MTPSAKPQTAAGRARIERVTEWAGTETQLIPPELAEVLAIEREAAAAATERVREGLHERVDFGVFDGDKADLHLTFDAILDAAQAAGGQP